MRIRGKNTWKKKIIGAVIAAMMMPQIGAFAPLVSYAAEGDVEINETNFPDDSFRAFVDEKYDIDGDEILSEKELENVTEINCSIMNINSLKGIEFFHSLEDLWCQQNQLTDLDVSRNTSLITLVCNDNEIQELDVSKNTNLVFLHCNNNKLTKLDINKNVELETIYCEDNQITDLDVSNNSFLSGLRCGNNNLTELDVSKNKWLFQLWCYGNRLSELDVSNNSGLSELKCGQNPITKIDVSKNEELSYLYVGGSKLNELDVSNNSNLNGLYCEDNQLSSLDVSNNSNLVELRCERNNLEELSVNTNKKLSKLYCGSNYFSEVDVSSCVIEDSDGTIDENHILHVETKEKPEEGVAINETNFPDEIFRQYVSVNFDTDGDGILSENEIESIKEISVPYKGIDSLQGIDYFSKLNVLSCDGNWLKELDVSKNTELTTLYCDSTQLTKLDISKNTSLTELSCFSNQLTELDVSKNTALIQLSCGQNIMTELDVSKNTALTELYCFSNQLTKLDVSKNTELTTLYCYSNQLPKLDVSNNKKLRKLYCNNNNYSSVDVSFCQIIDSDGTIDENDILHVKSNEEETIDISNCNVTVANAVYTGARITPAVTVKNGTTTLKKNTDYTVTYSNNINAGTAKVTITGMGNYTGTKNATFKITRRSITGATMTEVKARVYNGSEIRPAITVSLGGKKLVKNTDYIVDFLQNVNVGTATIRVTGSGNYTGSFKKTFKILPKGTTVRGLTPVIKGFTVRWDKQATAMKTSRITGYQIQIVFSVLEALRRIHSMGLIHRDISPDNIFICKNHKIKLIDFGAAIYDKKHTNLSRSVVLKFGYAPVEQYSTHGDIGTWSDIYAFGATMYYMVTMTLPFESVERAIEDRLTEPKALNPEVTDDINRVIMRAMRVNQRDRYQTAEEMYADLSKGTSDTPSSENDSPTIKIPPSEPLPNPASNPMTDSASQWSRNPLPASQDPTSRVYPQKDTPTATRTLTAIAIALFALIMISVATIFITKNRSATQDKDMDSRNEKVSTDDTVYNVEILYAVKTANGWMTWNSDGNISGAASADNPACGIKIDVHKDPNLGVSYLGYSASSGWSDAKAGGEPLEYDGENEYLEALQLSLAGSAAPKYDVYYRVHIPDYGWLAFAKNGDPAGSQGLSLPIDAIQIDVVKKGKEIKHDMGGFTSDHTSPFVGSEH